MERLDPKQPNHILIGLGGTGGKILKAFRKRIMREFPDDEERNKLSIGYVYVDSTREMMTPGDPTFKVLGKDASFTESEFVDIKSIDLDSILDRPSSYPGLSHIVRNGESMRRTLGEVGKAAGQKRRAGRILFASNVDKYISAVKGQYDKVKRLTKKDQVSIHIFTGLAGGTGSGSIVDAVAQLLNDYTIKGNLENLMVYAMVPELNPPAGWDAGRYMQNGYAALKELSAMNAGVFAPSDVLSGNEHVEGIISSANKRFGIMLYSNVNENGVVVDSSKELPELMADMLYFRLFLEEKSGETDDYLRAFTLENINDFAVEYSEKSKGKEKMPARTKAVNTFGIKRIVYPEQLIVEHISYALGENMIYQMLYNNYKEDFGYEETPKGRDYKGTYIDEGAYLKQWKMDRSHLMLEEKIFESDKNIETFDKFWDAKIGFNTLEDAKSADPQNPLPYVRDFCDTQYKQNFRQKLGVKEYFADKGNPRLVKEMTASIIDEYQKDLYAKWYNGDISLYDVTKINEVILDYLKAEKERIEKAYADLDKKIEEWGAELNDIEDDYASMGMIAKMGSKPRTLFEDFKAALKDYYKALTQKSAYEFAIKLVSSLRTGMQEYDSEMMQLLTLMRDTAETLQNKIADREQKKEKDDDGMGKAVIEVYEEEKMKNFEKTIVRDHPLMEKVSATFRHDVAGDRQNGSFTDLLNTLDQDQIILKIDTDLAETVEATHDELMMNDKILKLNVLQQLQKIYDTDDKLTAFARDVIEKSGTFLKLSDMEIKRKLKNNEDPSTSPHSINRKTVLITMPSAEGDDKLKAFSEKLKRKLEESFGNNTASSTLKFNVSDERKNEITIASVKYCFPIRALDWLKVYEKRYDAMINDPNEKLANDARIVLHSEGDGSKLPELTGEKSVSGQDFLPYIFVAAILGDIKIGENFNEEKGWCYMTQDDFGMETPNLLSEAFTDIFTSDELTEDVKDTLVEKIDEELARTDIKVSERENRVEAIKQLMKDYVIPECKNPASELYRKHAEAARKAMEMVSKK